MVWAFTNVSFESSELHFEEKEIDLASAKAADFIAVFFDWKKKK